MKRKRFLEFVWIDCVSFTVLMVILAILNLDFIFRTNAILEVFACTTAIAGLMNLTDRLPVENIWLQCLISWADVAVVVFLLGGLFHWFDFVLNDILLVFSILTAVFLITAGLFALQNQEYARKINAKLQGGKNNDCDG